MAATPTYKLKTPIVRQFKNGDDEIREETITEVTYRQLRAKDLRAGDAHTGDSAKTIALVAHMCGLTISEADQLSLDDFQELANATQGFIPGGQSTGQTA